MNEMIESMPICVARKPFEGTVAQNVLEHGTGALNIDACRVGSEQKQKTAGRRTIKWGVGEGGDTYQKGTGAEFTNEGRWPANLIHDGSKEVIDLFPYTTSGAMLKPYTYTNTGFSLGKPTGATRQIHESSEGRASRFFYCCKDKMELKDYLIKLVTPSGGITLDPFRKIIRLIQ
jgi:site-specific DNA-methyltransferase (adenine-specific)